jgi:hypothetical protein
MMKIILFGQKSKIFTLGQKNTYEWGDAQEKDGVVPLKTCSF